MIVARARDRCISPPFFTPFLLLHASISPFSSCAQYACQGKATTTVPSAMQCSNGNYLSIDPTRGKRGEDNGGGGGR